MFSLPCPLAQDAPSHSTISAGDLGQTRPHLHSSPPERSSTLHTTRQLGSPGQVLDALAWLRLHVAAWPSTVAPGSSDSSPERSQCADAKWPSCKWNTRGAHGSSLVLSRVASGLAAAPEEGRGRGRGPPGRSRFPPCMRTAVKHSLGVAAPLLPGLSWPNSSGPFSSLSSIFPGRCGDDTHRQVHL